MEAVDGLGAGLGGTFRLTGGAGGDSVDGGGGGRAPGGLGALGGFGAGAEGGVGLELSESERYAASARFAPVSTPPRLRSLGIPPANRPPSCGADGILPPLVLSPLERPSLLLRSLFATPPGGTGGASPPGGFGTGGAPPIAGPADFPGSFWIIGADLSFVTVFFKRVPLVIS